MVEEGAINRVTNGASRLIVAGMKQLFSAMAILTVLVGCVSGAPPSGVERAIYTVTTNYVTNVSNYVQIDTNRVVTNVVWFTNVSASYNLHPREEATETIVAVGAVGAGFGLPWLVPVIGLLGGLYAWWAEFRNSRKKTINKTFAQHIETAREIIKRQQGGAVSESRFMDVVKSDQVRAGVKLDAKEIADTMVDTMKAKETAADIIALTA